MKDVCAGIFNVDLRTKQVVKLCCGYYSNVNTFLFSLFYKESNFLQKLPDFFSEQLVFCIHGKSYGHVGTVS